MHILKRKVIYSMYRDYLKMEEVEVIEYIGRIFWREQMPEGTKYLKVDYEKFESSKGKEIWKNPL